ncbi:hypothetical protein ACTD5D_18830 [Nocardia takedensis]|uniref:hypothetical protein n=1 Tax=Nocardia takedensis TaxID=259390 RepID=UPI0002EE4E05|nr:hypothetical protein [Nocardia takedensis]
MNGAFDSVFVNARSTARDEQSPADAVSAGLLTPDVLLAAVAGHLPDGPPLAVWARELSDLHAVLLTHRITPGRRAVDFDHARIGAQVRDTIRAVDEWAAARFPGACGARRSTHSLGEVISHVARTYVEVWWAVRHRADHQHQAWAHLAEVRDGYADLVADLAAGRVKLPVGWRGVDVDHRTAAVSGSEV